MPKDVVKRKTIIDQYKKNNTDVGSSEVQIALLTDRINQLTEHLKSHKKDHHGRYGLLQLVSRRKRLMKYLSRTDNPKYASMISSLGIRG
jgi:small subunit ribosomal protein S15